MSMVEEHLTVTEFDDEGIYSKSKHGKEIDELLVRLQSIESLDGVLAVHVGMVPSEAEGRRWYLHHFRTEDNAAKERAFLAAHSYNADYLLAISETARQKHQHIRAAHGKDEEEHAVKHKLSHHHLVNDVFSISHCDWTTEPSGSPAANYPAVRVGVTKAKEGTSAEELDECIKEMRSLPARFALLGEVSIGKSDSAAFVAPLHYPGAIDWDLGFVFSYASAHDRSELDKDLEFNAVQKKWSSVLGGDHHFWDLDVDGAAA